MPPPPKQSRKKFAARTMRGVRAGRTFAEDTQTRVFDAFASMAAGTYDTGKLLNDVMGQASDFIDAVRTFMGGGSDVERVTLIVVNNNVPKEDLVLLSDVVQGMILERTDLVGVSNAAAADVIPKASYSVLRADGTNIPNNEEVEQVLVRLTAAPPAHGMYRGAIMSGKTKVLAEVVVYSTPP